MREINGVSALEMTMRDVMAGLEDMATDFAYASAPDCFEILAIEAPEVTPEPLVERPLTTPAPVISLAEVRRKVA